MGSRLQEALRRLCVDIGWSYAVFWTPIRFSNQIQLVWGDGHCVKASGVPAISGFDAMDLLLKEKMVLRNPSEGIVAHLGCPSEDRLAMLFHKLMVPQVHVVGDGIVGEAGLTGNHWWIVKENPNDYGCTLKALTELKQQFSAGIQTIAIIPLLPHGVVQLGSPMMVMEDVGFINHVRRMFAQLASDAVAPLPGILLNDLTQKNLVHNSHGVPVSVAANVNSTQAYGKSSAVDMTLIKQTSSSSMIHPNDSSQQMFHLDLHSNICFDMQLENEKLRSLLGVYDSGFRSSNNLLPNVSRSAIKNRSVAETSDPCHRSLMQIEKELSLPSDGLLDPVNSSDVLMLDGTRHILLESDEFNSNSMLFSDKSKLNQVAILNSMKVPEIHKFDRSVKSEVLSVDMKPSNTTSVNRKLQTMSIAENLKQEENLFQDLDITSIESDQYFSCFQSVQGDLQVGCSNNKYASQEKSSHSDVCLEKGTCSATNKIYTEVPDSTEPLHALGEKKLLVSSQLHEGNDLFDVLGLEYEHRSLDGSPLQLPSPSEGVLACITERDASSLIDAMDEDVTCSGVLPEAEPDQLLDAIISRINSGGKHKSDDGVPCKGSVVKIESSPFHPGSAGNVSGSSLKLMAGQYVDASPVPKTEVPASNSVKSESTDKTEGGSHRDSGYKSQIGLWTGSGQSVASDSISAGHCKWVDEVGKSGRKRSRPGENPRARPKDRQMVQDRIKELREIVPNGAKCSIDALLEKTIKHMLFLQSVAKHADKLKETVEPKIISKEGAVLLKDNFEGGATWAFEVGTQSMACPIIVEDLSSPRQMLIEVLCKGRGLFLEIADQIRGLGLTILKGVMEVWKDKVWARFAVEATRDVTRMEIFLSLVHLLEPAAGSSISPKGVENISLPHGTFTPSIPATGFFDCLR